MFRARRGLRARLRIRPGDSGRRRGRGCCRRRRWKEEMCEQIFGLERREVAAVMEREGTMEQIAVWIFFSGSQWRRRWSTPEIACLLSFFQVLLFYFSKLSLGSFHSQTLNFCLKIFVLSFHDFRVLLTKYHLIWILFDYSCSFNPPFLPCLRNT